jgi:hypothetical protein
MENKKISHKFGCKLKNGWITGDVEIKIHGKPEESEIETE